MQVMWMQIMFKTLINMWFNITKTPFFRAKLSQHGTCVSSAINIKQKE